MQFPSVCPYHNATYHIAIVEINSGMTVNAIGPFVRYWNEIEDSTVTIQLIEEGLQINKFYNTTIDVITIAGEESTSFTFGKLLYTCTKSNYSHHSCFVVCPYS